jgi:maleate isomerase
MRSILRDEALKLTNGPRAAIPRARTAIGVITPSANIVVEQATIRLMRAFPAVGANFSRAPVKGRPDLDEDGYDLEAMLSAARLLADAAPGILLWAGSKGVQLGVEKERLLCERIEDETGLAVTTPTLALEKLVRDRGIGAVGLISPYSRAYQTRLVEGFDRMGIACVAEAHAGVDDNLAYASIGNAKIRHMARRVAAARPDAILAWCTNFAAGPLAGAIEREVGVPFYDATSLGLSRALTILGVDFTRAPALWGAAFRRHSLLEPA